MCVCVCLRACLLACLLCERPCLFASVFTDACTRACAFLTARTRAYTPAQKSQQFHNIPTPYMHEGRAGVPVVQNLAWNVVAPDLTVAVVVVECDVTQQLHSGSLQKKGLMQVVSPSLEHAFSLFMHS